MIRATFATSLAGLTLGIAAGVATFIPAIHGLSPIERAWVHNAPRGRA